MIHNIVCSALSSKSVTEREQGSIQGAMSAVRSIGAAIGVHMCLCLC